MPKDYAVTVTELEECALSLTTLLNRINDGKKAHTREELLQAFADCQIDIFDYCKDNGIKVTGLDPIKLFAFSIPHLRRIAPDADMSVYLTACILIAVGKHRASVPEHLAGSLAVCEHLSKKYPTEHVVVYAYIKGLQEAIDLRWLESVGRPGM